MSPKQKLQRDLQEMIILVALTSTPIYMHQAPSTPLYTYQLTNNTPKHRTNVATIDKLATNTTFLRASPFIRTTCHTYFRFKVVIYFVIMVKWFEYSQIFIYLAGTEVGISMFIPGFTLDSYFDLNFPYAEHPAAGPCPLAPRTENAIRLGGR